LTTGSFHCFSVSQCLLALLHFWCPFIALPFYQIQQVGETDDSKIIFTSALDENHLNSLYRMKGYPTYFQECLHKESDIRVTVVGEKVFAAKIYSQALDETKIDWRKGDSIKLNYSVYQLPDRIRELCLSLLNQLHLNFGAIDFVETQDGRLVFLEINPNGQWGWIEKRLDLPISDEIIRLLNEGSQFVKAK
jgi:glutathione synthase/RimK-type ligase-like ATP-grasp enzyme